MKFNQTEVALNSFGNLNVDKTEGVISNVLLARVGKVKGHGMYADETFTQQIVDKGNEFGTIGMKARFGHPNASSTTLGSFIGRWHNFSFKDGNAHAELRLDEITKKTQVEGKGISMWEYITEMASSNPDMFGNSIVFRAAESETKRVEVNLKDVDRAYDYVIEYKEKTAIVERDFARIHSLTASDLVDSPAATESLFDSFSTDEDFAYHMTTFLDSNPKIYKLLSENPEVIDGFMTKYEDYKTKQTEMSKENQELSQEEQTMFTGFLKRLGLQKIKKDENLSGEETPEEETPEVPEEEVPETPEAPEEETPETPEEETPEELSAEAIELAELKIAHKAQKAELAKFTTKPAGTKAKADPNVGTTVLSDSEKNFNEVAESFKQK